jgi:cell division septal protein FtsQ
MAVTAPADRRFRRSQIHATRRRRLRTRPFWRGLRAVILLAVLAFGGYWAAQAAVDLPWLRVQHIHVHGNQRVHAGEVLTLLDGLKGGNLLTTDLDRWRSRLFASAWVADATLRRRLPGTVDVEIRERVPMGIARVGTTLILMDAAGIAIDEYGPRYADCDLPIIDGLVGNPSSLPLQVDGARSQLVSRLMSELRTRPDLAQRVSQIDVQDAHDVHVILDGDSAVVRLGDTQFVERLESYVGLQAAIRKQVPDIDYVDLRFGKHVAVRPASSAVADPAPGATAPRAQVPGPRPQR